MSDDVAVAACEGADASLLEGSAEGEGGEEALPRALPLAMAVASGAEEEELEGGALSEAPPLADASGVAPLVAVGTVD